MPSATFAARLADIVGLHVDPSERALDEKFQIEALDRTPPGLPLEPGKAGRTPQNAERNGITLCSAPSTCSTAPVLGGCMQRHRHQEFPRFLRAIERAVPAGKVIHAILDVSEATSTERSSSGSPARHGLPSGAARRLTISLPTIRQSRALCRARPGAAPAFRMNQTNPNRSHVNQLTLAASSRRDGGLKFGQGGASSGGGALAWNS